MTISKIRITGFFFAFFAVVMAFSSCKKDSSPFKESADPDTNFRNVMTMAREINEYTLADMQTYTEDMQRTIFNQMSAANRARIINERIEQAKTEETDQNRISALSSVEGLITEDLYSDTQDPNTVAKVAAWIDQNMMLFGYDRMKIIVTTLGGSADKPNAPTGSTTTGAVDCGCNQKDDWCPGGASTSCNKSTCDQSSWGCGSFFLSRCNGKCGFVI